LTGNFVIFIGAKKFSNNPTKTLLTVPRSAVRFSPPDNGVAHFWVTAQMLDPQGQVGELRLKIHQMWRAEAQQLTAAVAS
jgi:hypothetical protein